MVFGLNDEGVRIKAEKTGQRAECPYCGGVLIAKCGEIYINHWQHSLQMDCDPWQEHETEWHLNWKSRFPESWREVIINQHGIKHIADVKTDLGIVIEFQNSFISTSDIRVREDFYKNMIWVINAENFEENFKIRSVVNTKLRRVEEDYSQGFSNIRKGYEDKIKELNKEVEDNERLSKQKRQNIEYQKKLIDKLLLRVESIDEIVQAAITEWSFGRYYSDDLAIQTFQSIEKTDKDSFKEVQILTQSCQDLIFRIQQYKSELENSVDIYQNGKMFKLIKFERLSPQKFSKIIAISKPNFDNIFRDVRYFQSEEDFKTISFRKNHFHFGIEYLPENENIEKAIFLENSKIAELKQRFDSMKQKITDIIKKGYLDEIDELEKSIEKLNEEWEDIICAETKVSMDLEILKENMEFEISKAQTTLESQKKTKRKDIMLTHKGLYTYNWSHERKSWRAAKCQLFFDVGDHLFKKIGEDMFRKITVDEFLSIYLNRNLKV